MEIGNKKGAVFHRVETYPRGPDAYRKWTDEDTFGDLERLVERVRGLKVGHVNATARGGGVAEILRSLVPLMNGLGDPFFLNFDPQAPFFD